MSEYEYLSLSLQQRIFEKLLMVPGVATYDSADYADERQGDEELLEDVEAFIKSSNG